MTIFVMRHASSYWYFYVYLGCCDLKRLVIGEPFNWLRAVKSGDLVFVWPITEPDSRAFPLEDPKLIWGLETTKNAQRLPCLETASEEQP